MYRVGMAGVPGISRQVPPAAGGRGYGFGRRTELIAGPGGPLGLGYGWVGLWQIKAELLREGGVHLGGEVEVVLEGLVEAVEGVAAVVVFALRELAIGVEVEGV